MKKEKANYMRKMWILALTIFIFLLSTSSLFGQLGFYLGIQGGYSAQKIQFRDIDFDTNSSFLYGIRVGLKVMTFGLEANYFQVAHNIEFKELVTLDWGERKVDYSYVGLNFKIFFPVVLINPYVTFGYGYYTVDILNVDRNTEKGFNLGAGLEVMLGKKFSLLAEGKYHHAKVKIQDEDLDVGNFTFCGGLSVYF